ncbi:MAG TPA: hypothetical protein DIW47_11880 [Bacteroidetes bacterium]|nr:hypothetical protein [Bacteroidota bacterium]
MPEEVIISKIYHIREKKVMLSSDLAELYQVETKALNQQVKRNTGKFPERYMFRLTQEEYKSLRSQNVTLKRGQHAKYPPYSFRKRQEQQSDLNLRKRNNSSLPKTWRPKN